MPDLTRAPFAQLLANRRACVAICIGVALHFGLATVGLLGMWCPAADLGVPCPGCGLSRALGALARWDLDQMLVLHVFAPVAALGLLTVLLAATLPRPTTARLVARVAAAERRTSFALSLCLGIVVYWGLRLAFASSATLELLRGTGS